MTNETQRMLGAFQGGEQSDGRLTDAELGRLVRENLQRVGVVRIVVHGKDGKERIDAERAERVHPGIRKL